MARTNHFTIYTKGTLTLNLEPDLRLGQASLTLFTAAGGFDSSTAEAQDFLQVGSAFGVGEWSRVDFMLILVHRPSLNKRFRLCESNAHQPSPRLRLLGLSTKTVQVCPLEVIREERDAQKAGHFQLPLPSNTMGAHVPFIQRICFLREPQ